MMFVYLKNKSNNTVKHAQKALGQAKQQSVTFLGAIFHSRLEIFSKGN